MNDNRGVQPAAADVASSGEQDEAGRAADSQQQLRRRQDELLDEALEETFPASDPISPSRPT